MDDFINLNKFLKGSPLLNPLKGYFPAYLSQLLEFSIESWENENIEKALKYCDEFNTQSKDTIVGFLLAFVIKSSEYSTEQAINEFKKIKLKEKFSKNEKVLFHLIKGSLLFKNLDIDEAKNEFDIVIKLDKKEYSAYILRGQCNALRNRHYLAIPDFKIGLKENYKTNEIKANLAYSYLRNRDVWKSLVLHRMIVNKFPSNEKIQYNMGICYKRFKRYRTSIKYFNRAIELDETNGGFRITRARVLMKLKKHIEAKNDLIYGAKNNIMFSQELLEINEKVITKRISIKQSEIEIKKLLQK